MNSSRKQQGRQSAYRKRKPIIIITSSIIVFTIILSAFQSSKPMSDTTCILKNRNGFEVHILSTGATIQRVILPTATDVVLGFDSTLPYKDGTSPYMGAIVGRVANRIANATFTLNNQTYKLVANNGPNTLHGGTIGFDKKGWLFVDKQDTSCTLQYTSKDGEEGFPATVTVTATYTIDLEKCHLKLDIKGTVVEEQGKEGMFMKTPLSLAQHSYFNLAGHNSKESILDHLLTLPTASHYTPIDSTLIPTGDILPVDGTAFDFSTQHRIGDNIDNIPNVATTGGYDHNYVLHNLGPEAREKVLPTGMAFENTTKLAAVVVHPGSGTTMEVWTNAPGVQFYTGNFLDGTLTGKGGAVYTKHGGMCLETQGFPNAVNQDNFPNVVVGPGEEYYHIVEYKFN
jgi:aldose 1-epimerase